jgi:hypothetical protein
MGGISKLSLLLGVLWSTCPVQALAGGGHYLSVDLSLSEKKEIPCRISTLQAGRCDFGDETSLVTTVNRPSMTETTTIQ